MRRYLGEGGSLAGALAGYGERDAQLRMAEAVEATLGAGGVLICEAGTGTGKSLAYLIPAALSGKTVVVATATKALQSQLLHGDLPLAAAVLGRPIRAQLLKGRANYACRLLADDVGARVLDERYGAALEAIRPWLAETATGDRAELPIEPPAELWAELAVGPDRCRGARCPVVNECFSERARRLASEAQVVLVNHALYFADLGLRRVSDGAVAILPDHDAVIFDEAHELEDAAAEWLGARLGMVDLMLLARDAERACIRDGHQKPAGPLHALERDGAVLFGSLEVPGGGRRRLREADLRALPPQALAGLRGALGAIASALGGAGEECDLVSRRAERLGFALEACVHADLDETVVWSERTGPGSAGLRSAPIDVGPLLRESLWDEMGAAVLTSATLAVGGDLGFTRRRLGIRSAEELVLASPFDTAEQALLYLPRDAPDPRSEGWEEQVARQLIALVRATRGRALCLFTSRRALEQVHALAAPALAGVTVLRQGEAPRERLLERFREDVGSVLFATASFWQGVDIPGESCSCVVIDRLPFAAPNEPLVQARCERIEREGGSWFSDYSLPAAALTLKQGFGRLLRSETDRGVVCVLDGRLRSARYGPELLAALPPTRVVAELSEVEEFFGEPAVVSPGSGYSHPR